MLTRRRRTAALLVALVLPLAAACSDGAPDAATLLDEATQRGQYGVGVTTLELKDASRPTAPNRAFPGSDTRAFAVEVWYPADEGAAMPEERDGDLDRSGAPYPLIVFAHGLSSTRRQSASYTQHLASHGYVVVAPDFPLSQLEAPGGPRLAAVLEQPEDVSFVIDRIHDFNEAEGHLLEGAIDGGVIGLSGHSLGALTTMLTIYGEPRDERIDAAVAISPVGCFLPDQLGRGNATALLVVGGTNDLITPLETSRRAYDAAPPPRYLIVLRGGDHTRFADIDISDAVIVESGVLDQILGDEVAQDSIAIAEATGGDAVTCAGTVGEQEASDPPLSADRQRELLRIVATLFFDGYLRGEENELRFLQDELASAGPEVVLELDVD